MAVRGRPTTALEDRRTCNLQLRLTRDEMEQLGRLHAAACLDRGRDVPLAEIARELITSHPRWERAATPISTTCEECGSPLTMRGPNGEPCCARCGSRDVRTVPADDDE